MTLRVNARRMSREAYQGELVKAGLQGNPTRFAPHGIQLATPVPVDQLPWFADGVVSVQDEAAQLCTTLLDLAPELALPDGTTVAELRRDCPDNQLRKLPAQAHP